jgi:hypothetical protein
LNGTKGLYKIDGDYMMQSLRPTTATSQEIEFNPELLNLPACAELGRADASEKHSQLDDRSCKLGYCADRRESAEPTSIPTAVEAQNYNQILPAALQNAITKGQWTEAEKLLCQKSSPLLRGRRPLSFEARARTRGASNKIQMLVALRRQRFLELLEEKDIVRALLVLEENIIPLCQDITYLRHLVR